MHHLHLARSPAGRIRATRRTQCDETTEGGIAQRDARETARTVDGDGGPTREAAWIVASGDRSRCVARCMLQPHLLRRCRHSPDRERQHHEHRGRRRGELGGDRTELATGPIAP